MKLCQKCGNDVVALLGIKGSDAIQWWLDNPSVSESECEFWAHKAMLKVGMSIDVTTIDGKKKIFGQVLALSVNEVVDGFAMITVEPK